MTSSLANLEKAIKQAISGIKRSKTGSNGVSKWLDECICAIQLAAASYRSECEEAHLHDNQIERRDKPQPGLDKQVGERDKEYVEHGKQFAVLLGSLLKLSGFGSLLSSDGCNLCFAALSTLGTVCKENDIYAHSLPPLILPNSLRHYQDSICYAMYESDGVSQLISIMMTPSAKLSLVEEATKTLTILASTCSMN